MAKQLNQLLCSDGTLAHYWYINGDYLGRCRKCQATRYFPPSTEGEKLQEWQINPRTKGRKGKVETEAVELYT